MNPFDVLGTKSSASEADIQSSYRHLAKQFHPDQHPAASPAERAQFERTMSTINAAYNELKTPEGRAEWSQRVASSDNQMPQASRFRPPGGNECALCGYGPAREFGFGHQNAWIFLTTQYTTQLQMCRNCALSFGRSKQNRTLWTGWWGVLAFFRNLTVVWGNARELRAAASMQSPHRVENVVAYIDSPLEPGKSLFKRSGVYALAAAVSIFLGIGAVDSATQTPPGGSTGGGPSVTENPFAEEIGWTTGSCVDEDSDGVWPVSCSDIHIGEIIVTVYVVEDCPAQTDSYVEDQDFVFCIDEDV